MSIAAAVLISLVVVFMVIGVPIALSLGAAGVAPLILNGKPPLLILPQRLIAAVDSFPMMAVIFFVLAGELMLQGGISKRLVNLATCMFGNIKGSLAVISIITCAFFGALSGSSLATTAAIGGIMYPEMVKDGYEKSFSATLQSAGGILGVLIPPSIPLVVFGVVTGASVGDLFLAVIPAGIILTVLFIIASYFVIGREKMAITNSRPETTFGKALFQAVWALFMPIIILGGIYTGVFTPTESAIVACLYALLVGIFVYRTLRPAVLYEVLKSTAVTSAAVMFLVACAAFFGWVMTHLNIPQSVTAFLVSAIHTRTAFLFMVIIILLAAGMLLDTAVCILLVMPLIFPVSQRFDIHPTHLGILTVVNLGLGNITPPFGATLFVSSSMTKVPIDSIYKRVWPFIAVGLIDIFLVTYWEGLSIGFLNMFR